MCVCVCVFVCVYIRFVHACVHHIFRHVSFMLIKISIKYMMVEAVMVISIQIMVFWFVKLCSLRWDTSVLEEPDASIIK